MNNPFLDRRFGLARGFDHWDHEPGSDLASRRADEMVDRFLAWQESHAGVRSFALLHFFDPHMSYDAPPPFGGRFTGALGTPRSARFDGPVRDTQAIRDALTDLDAGDRAHVSAAYDEEVAWVDAQLARLLGILDERGVLEHTLVALTADHGEEHFEHGGFGHGHSVTQELLHVPLAFWGGAVRGARLGAPVSIVDLPATFLDAVGLPVPEGGVSLWPRLRGADAATDAAVRTLVAENPGSADEAAVALEWPFKLVRLDVRARNRSSTWRPIPVSAKTWRPRVRRCAAAWGPPDPSSGGSGCNGPAGATRSRTRRAPAQPGLHGMRIVRRDKGPARKRRSRSGRDFCGRCRPRRLPCSRHGRTRCCYAASADLDRR